MKEDFLEEVQLTLNSEKKVKIEDVFRQYENWDSLSYLALNLMIEENYGIEIPRDVFGQMETFEDIYNYIKEIKKIEEQD